VDKFENAIVDAIVQQFFVGIEYRTDYGTQRSEPAATKLATQILQQNQNEIVEALSERIDLGKLAQEIAEGLAQSLVSNFWGYSNNAEQLKDEVIKRFADIKAHQMIEEENNKDEK
jgi:hypothetical protein